MVPSCSSVAVRATVLAEMERLVQCELGRGDDLVLAE
jgi:hypothetical protein